MNTLPTGAKALLDAVSPGAKAALAIWGTAIAWDLVCNEEQTISHAVARGLRDPHTRVPVAAVIVMSVAHVAAMAMGYGYAKTSTATGRCG
jgi:hypothetical protein